MREKVTPRKGRALLAPTANQERRCLTEAANLQTPIDLYRSQVQDLVPHETHDLVYFLYLHQYIYEKHTQDTYDYPQNSCRRKMREMLWGKCLEKQSNSLMNTITEGLCQAA